MKLKYLAFCLILPLLTNCTSTSSDNIINTGEMSDEEFNRLSNDEKEFEIAYEYLDYLYLFAHSDSLVPKGTTWYRQLEPRKYYKGLGSSQLSVKIEMPPEIIDAYYMYLTMNDEYTMYIPPQIMDFENFLSDFEERIDVSDVGLNVYPASREDSSALVVMQVYKGSAADLLGMQIGDTILTIAGVQTNNKTVFDKLASGTEKSVVDITVARNVNGERVTKDFTIPLISYIPPTVTHRIQDSIAVIEISEFAIENTPSNRGTYGEFLDALKETENSKATIIDLRGNPGGDVAMCDSVTRAMLHKKDTIGFTAQAYIDSMTIDPVIMNTMDYVDEEGVAGDRYFVFLADSNSASCSEYTIMGVTNTKKSPLIGMTTHGKGIAYVILPSYLNGAMLITNSMILDKERKSYHMRGLEPDINLNNYDKMLDTAFTIANEGTMTRTHGYSEKVRKIYTEPLTKGGQGIAFPTKKNLGMYKVLRSPLPTK